MPASPTDPRRILVIQGHPEHRSTHLCHRLADAYARGATSAGHDVRHLDIAALDFPLLRDREDWEHGAVPAGLRGAQEDMAWAHHIVLLFPLWLGDMPALVKGFLEQVLRPGFAFARDEGTLLGTKLLAGRSARIVVTMGMPAAVYRWVFRAHSVRSLERNILGFVGIGPVHESLVGSVEQLDARKIAQWEPRMAAMGASQAG